jgi:adenylosuccinate lyase
MHSDENTKPKSRGVDSDTDTALLAAGRYGTDDMIETWGPEQTFEKSLYVQAQSVGTMSDMDPEVVPADLARELMSKANLTDIDPQRIRVLEALRNHDVIAINEAWSEQVSSAAAAHINKAKTSADTTVNAKALQLKRSLEIIADSVENLRDITLERSLEWIHVPHMDQTHLYDALPTVAGRPFSFFAELLQSGLDRIKFVYQNSLIGKWGDATGNHHAATALGLDGMKLQQQFCESVGLGYMTAPGQIPGREYIFDVVFSLARIGESVGNLAHYIRWGRSDDVGLFKVPLKGDKGSSAMPHKDAKGGNPTVEEQAESFTNYMEGVLVAAAANCRIDYARELSGSASDRVNLEDAFKFGDHVIRRLAGRMYELILDGNRSKERFLRSWGCTTSAQVMTYLTDHRRTDSPMTREEAHNLTAEIATRAYKIKRPFVDELLDSEEITSRLDESTIREISDPVRYIGQSKEIVRKVFDNYHGQKTLEAPN